MPKPTVQTRVLNNVEIALIVESLLKHGSTDARKLADMVQDAGAIVMSRTV